MGVGHFDIVAEHVVIADFQACDACCFHFPALYFQQVVFTLVGDFPQLVKFGVDTGLYHIATVELVGGFVDDFGSDAVAHQRAWVELFADCFKRGGFGLFKGCLYRFDGGQGVAHLHHLAWGNPACRHFCYQTFEVAYAFELFAQVFAVVGVFEEIFKGVEAGIDFLWVFERECDPPPQHPCPHRADGAVDNIEEAFAVLPERVEQL